ncbi:MAG: type I secretion system permease/ATPase, partial [Gammaproteobacteria bacterium]|nr:type I secretion system permease/ATPase [Gammaproteobacteria bacterium]
MILSQDDLLLDCLLMLAKQHGISVSKQALTAGLPLVDRRLTPKLFVKAAKRLEMRARIVTPALTEISHLVLPAVILLKNNRACLLTRITDEKQYEVVLPEADGGKEILSLQALQEDYSGYAIYVKPQHKFEKRASEYLVDRPQSWLWSTVSRYRKYYYSVIVAAIMINLFAIASPLFVMNVYDRVVPNNAFTTLWVLAIGVAIVFIFDFLLRTLRAYLIDISGKKTDVLLSSMIFQQALDLKMSAKPASTGAFVNNLQGYEAVRDFFTSATLTSIVDLPFILFLLFVIWLIGSSIVLVPLFMVPIVIVVSLLVELPIRQAAKKMFLGGAQKQAVLYESLNSLETVKTLLMSGGRLKLWEKYVNYTAQAANRSRVFSAIATNFANYAMQMNTVIVVIVGVHLFSQGEISLGGLIASVILGARCIAPLVQVAGLITRYQQARMGLDALNKIMQLPCERHQAASYIHRPKLTGAIEFEEVDFSYPEQAGPALKNISFTIKAGEKVAILGQNGSGKSTILRLILALYQPLAGKVKLDAIDSSQIDPADIRSHIGSCLQTNALFYGTLRDNLTLAEPTISETELIKIAKLTGVDRISEEHPLGYQRMIGETGEGLSGGQMQAITLARALLAPSSMLLLDEPTSLMDSNAEAQIIKNLQTHLQDKTLVLVTHKVAMLALVDRIIVLKDGRIA